MMIKHKAMISQSGEVLAKDIEVWLDVIAERSGMRSWHGALLAPLNSRLSMFNENKENMRLHLDDGREGEFFVTRQTFGSHEPNRLQFQGTGPLENPSKANI